MKRILLAAAAAGLFAAAPAVLFAQKPSAEEESAKLVEVLKSDASLFQKAKACQRLAVVGTKDAVPVLAGLLSDEKLGHYARFGLEPIPDPSVDDVLCEAMVKLKGRLLVGVIDSIGVRRSERALGKLTGLLDDADPEVASSAAAAIGRIGIPEASATLQKALAGSPMGLRAAVAEASLQCAEALLAKGNREGAVALYDAVRKAEVPQHFRTAATRGAILERQAAGTPLLAECLRGSDEALFVMALGVARRVPGSEATRAIVAELKGLPPARQALVIGALGDRRDSAAGPAVLEAARGGPPEVRIAALRVLGSVGGSSAVPVLLETATGSEREAAQAAQAALESLEGKEVDAAIVALLEGGKAKLGPATIALVGRRHIRSAVPALQKAADAEDEQIRLAAIQALGDAVGIEDLPVLIARALEARNPQDRAAAREALRAACKRLPDKDASAGKIIESMAGASPEGKRLLLEALGSSGGKKALQAVSASARDEVEMRDLTIRVLGEWMTEDAAPEILALVKKSDASTDRLALLRSFKSVVSRLRFPKEERLGLCQEAMGAARSDEEKKVVLGTLAAIPAAETFPLLTPHFSSPALKEDACSAAVTIGERLIRFQPKAVLEAMRQVVQATENKDLAERARKLIRQAGG